MVKRSLKITHCTLFNLHYTVKGIPAGFKILKVTNFKEEFLEYINVNSQLLFYVSIPHFKLTDIKF